MKEEILESIGLTKNEVKVYLALLSLGSSTSGAVIKKTGLHRAYVYEILEKLEQKGLVGHSIKANRKYFEAATPEKFLEILNEKKQELEKKEKEIKAFLPELLKEKALGEEIEASIYKGKKGLQTIFNDMLSTKELLCIGATGQFRTVLEYFYPGFVKRLMKAKIKVKIIYSEEKRGDIEMYTGKIVKFISKEFTSPLTIYIYGDRVAIILWSRQELLGILIKKQQIKESFKRYFNLLWKIAKK